MYRKYRIVECIASSVSQYESYRDQVYRYTPNNGNVGSKALLYIDPGQQMIYRVLLIPDS